MYTNFTEYWDEKKELSEKLNIMKAAAMLIWVDAVMCMKNELIKESEKKNYKQNIIN